MMKEIRNRQAQHGNPKKSIANSLERFQGTMSNSPATATRQIVNLPGRTPGLPFSDAVLVGDTLYLSGRIGIDPVTGRAPADLDAEIKLLLDGVDSVLREAGMTMDDLVSVQIFCPDVSLWEPFNAAYVKRFSGPLPARAFLGSGPLLLGGRFELMGIAVRRS
jgi:2-iminobutanoate/2-iminopropanoate deaminase